VKTRRAKGRKRRPRITAAAKQRAAATAAGRQQEKYSERKIPGTAQARMPRQGERGKENSKFEIRNSKC
jgi:hypothetical protein